MTASAPPRLGTWGRADSFVGVVTAIDESTGRVTLFDPGQRRQHTVESAAFEPVPTAAVRVALQVGLPVAHGLDERDLRRWVAMLTDPVLRERAAAALTEAGLDDGVTLPTVTVDVGPFDDGAGLCLCGATTAVARGAQDGPECPTCGRQVAPPVPSNDI